ncbi:MAG: TadE/TadG family type IV pilus assembly protein [Aminipila sp.]
MLKRFCNDESGQSAVMAAYIIILLVAVAGLVIDGSLLINKRIELEAATEAAALSTVAAVDIDKYEEDPSVVEIVQSEAELYAAYFLDENMHTATVDSCTVNPSKPSECVIKSSVEVDLIFMKCFGIEPQTIRTTVTGHVN